MCDPGERVGQRERTREVWNSRRARTLSCQVVQLTVAHLYPELLNIYADRGNIAVLNWRAAQRHIELTVCSVDDGTELPSDTDLVYIGGGQDRDQQLIAPDIARRGPALSSLVEAGCGLLAVCGGYQLLGQSYRDISGNEMPGAGLFPIRTRAEHHRLIGDVLLECDFVDGPPRRIAGFENHAGRTELDEGADSFGRVVHGFGNDGQSGYEGCRLGSAIGTYLHGPLLPRNPWLADWLLERALQHRTGEPRELPPLDDALESSAQELAGERARTRGGRF